MTYSIKFTDGSRVESPNDVGLVEKVVEHIHVYGRELEQVATRGKVMSNEELADIFQTIETSYREYADWIAKFTPST